MCNVKPQWGKKKSRQFLLNFCVRVNYHFSMIGSLTLTKSTVRWAQHWPGKQSPTPHPHPTPGKPDTPGNAVTYFSCQHHMDDSSYIMHIFRLLLSPVHHLSAVHHSKQFINFVTENWTFWCLAAAIGEMVL